VNVGGGFHHAYPDHGEGFCVLNDFAIGIRRLQKDKAIERAMTVDCDVHQGNGTAAIFAGDSTVYTLSIHQVNNYPYPKPPSTLDINLRDGVKDAEYLEELEKGLDHALNKFQPDLIYYVAGADPYRDDQLGGLKLSIEGLERRDGLVFAKACAKNIPVAVTLAGGYARRVEDTIEIHTNTIRVAKEFAKTPAAD
jgi:acetoin utilization deacetylase AcuC-like enzyme